MLLAYGRCGHCRSRLATATQEAWGRGRGEFRVSRTTFGDDVLELVRDRAVTGLSVGFIPRDDAWSPDRSRVTRVRADLVEVSVTAFPAYGATANVLGARRVVGEPTRRHRRAPGD